MIRASIVLALSLALGAACSRALPNPSPDFYAVEVAGGPRYEAPLRVVRNAVDKTGAAWKLEGFVPSEQWRSSIEAELARVPIEKGEDTFIALGENYPEPADAMSACSMVMIYPRNRCARVWSTRWLGVPGASFEGTETPVDRDDDGCRDWIVNVAGRRLLLLTKSGRIVAQ